MYQYIRWRYLWLPSWIYQKSRNKRNVWIRLSVQVFYPLYDCVTFDTKTFDTSWKWDVWYQWNLVSNVSLKRDVWYQLKMGRLILEVNSNQTSHFEWDVWSPRHGTFDLNIFSMHIWHMYEYVRKSICTNLIPSQHDCTYTQYTCIPSSVPLIRFEFPVFGMHSLLRERSIITESMVSFCIIYVLGVRVMRWCTYSNIPWDMTGNLTLIGWIRQMLNSTNHCHVAGDITGSIITHPYKLMLIYGWVTYIRLRKHICLVICATLIIYFFQMTFYTCLFTTFIQSRIFSKETIFNSPINHRHLPITRAK